MTPLSTEALEREPGARSGSLVTLTLQPGLPLGPFYQRVRLRLNHDDLEPIEMPVEGTIVGNVTVVGPPDEFDAELGLLKLGTLSGDAQHQRQLWVLIKGEDSSDDRSAGGRDRSGGASCRLHSANRCVWAI